MTAALTPRLLALARSVVKAQGYGALKMFAREMGVGYTGLCRRVKKPLAPDAGKAE